VLGSAFLAPTCSMGARAASRTNHTSAFTTSAFTTSAFTTSASSASSGASGGRTCACARAGGPEAGLLFENPSFRSWRQCRANGHAHYSGKIYLAAALRQNIFGCGSAAPTGMHNTQVKYIWLRQCRANGHAHYSGKIYLAAALRQNIFGCGSAAPTGMHTTQVKYIWLRHSGKIYLAAAVPRQRACTILR
jgi:hypothetical protein